MQRTMVVDAFLARIDQYDIRVGTRQPVAFAGQSPNSRAGFSLITRTSLGSSTSPRCAAVNISRFLPDRAGEREYQ
jgi:hypothetical protein